MSQIFARILRMPFHLVLIGIGIGLLARSIYPPESKVMAPRTFPEPLTESGDDSEQEEFTELPILKK